MSLPAASSWSGARYAGVLLVATVLILVAIAGGCSLADICQQGCNRVTSRGKMVPWTNLEPAILVVGCELELAPKPSLFFRYEQKRFYKGFRVFLLLAMSKTENYKGFRASSNLDPCQKS